MNVFPVPAGARTRAWRKVRSVSNVKEMMSDNQRQGDDPRGWFIRASNIKAIGSKVNIIESVGAAAGPQVHESAARLATSLVASDRISSDSFHTGAQSTSVMLERVLEIQSLVTSLVSRLLHAFIHLLR